MPSFNAETTWKLPVKDKKTLYGKHRIAVGGPAPEGADTEIGHLAIKHKKNLVSLPLILMFDVKYYVP